MWVLSFQQIVFRQLMNLVVIQSVSTIAYGTRTSWQRLRRLGVSAAPLDVPALLEQPRPE